jgi:Na+/melibiose symporter-like transporter
MTRILKNRFLPLLVGMVIIVISSVPLYFLTEESKYYVYPLMMLQGIGQAIFLNTSTSLISDVIGNDGESSAFVYGAYSFSDKLINGLVIERMIKSYSDDVAALKVIISATPIVCSVFALTITYIGAK